MWWPHGASRKRILLTGPSHRTIGPEPEWSELERDAAVGDSSGALGRRLEPAVNRREQRAVFDDGRS